MRTMSEVRNGNDIDIYEDIHRDIVEIVMLYCLFFLIIPTNDKAMMG
jgi:hypothetical protein